jgi:hypothetical protein
VRCRFDTKSDLAWSASAGVPRYNSYRGTLGAAVWSYDHACLASHRAESNVNDPSLPASGLGVGPRLVPQPCP